jgi:L-serine deaminase
VHGAGDVQIVQVKAHRFVATDGLPALSVKRLSPVLPVPSGKHLHVPFTSCDSMLAHDGDRQTPLWRLAVEYEMARGQFSEREVIDRMIAIVRILRRSIASGIAGTHHDDRMLGHQSGRFHDMMQAGRLLDGGALNRIILNVTALMDVKSSMGVIVAAPTAGACAALPGAVIGMAEAMGRGDEEMARAMLAAGLVGVFIATRWTFAAEVGGCQAEGGSAASMAAAALVTLAAGGTRDQAIAAASMASRACWDSSAIPSPAASRPRAGQERHGGQQCPLVREHGACGLRPAHPARRSHRRGPGRREPDAARASLHRPWRPGDHADVTRDRADARRAEGPRLRQLRLPLILAPRVTVSVPAPSMPLPPGARPWPCVDQHG